MASAKLFLMHTDVTDELMKIVPFSLPPAVLETALGYRRLADRNNYIAGRWLLHEYFRALSIDFDLNEICYSVYGKPYIKGGVQFSIAHTSGLAGLLISDFSVGLDIEQIRAIDDVIEFATVFNADELEKIKLEGMDTFFRLWTTKEAVLKMTGMGITDTTAVRSIKVGRNGSVLLNGQQIDTRNFIYANDFFVSIARPGPVCLEACVTICVAVIKQGTLLCKEAGVMKCGDNALEDVSVYWKSSSMET